MVFLVKNEILRKKSPNSGCACRKSRKWHFSHPEQNGDNTGSVVVVVVVLRFGLCRAYRLKRSKESNSRPNQAKLGSSLKYVFWIKVTFCLWEILEYGLVWIEVTFCLWEILEYGLVWTEVCVCVVYLPYFHPLAVVGEQRSLQETTEPGIFPPNRTEPNLKNLFTEPNRTEFRLPNRTEPHQIFPI